MAFSCKKPIPPRKRPKPKCSSVRSFRKEKIPAILYFHGGGFVKGDLDSYDLYLRRLAASSRCAILAVDYRLAPEYAYPAAHDDGYDSLCWLKENAKSLNLDEEKIILAGDSAGGHIAANIMTRLAEEKPNAFPSALILLYPVLDITLSYPSINMPKEKCLVTKEDLSWYYQQYFSSGLDPKDPLISPIFATNLHVFPPTLVILAEFDTLRDEGAAFVENLKRSGVKVKGNIFSEMIHGFIMFEEFAKAKEALNMISSFIHTSVLD